MVRNVKGFTFVELMVSMVILSIVITIITGTIVYSSKRNNQVYQGTHGYQVAKEKLIELQSDGARIQTFGIDSLDREGISYYREWTVDTRGNKPFPVEVFVTWYTNEKQDSASVIGYITGDVCGDNTGNAPTNIQLFNQADVDISSTAEINLLNTGDFVATVVATDSDVDDVVTLEMAPHDTFSLVGNTVKSAIDFETSGISSFTIIARDCSNKTLEKTFSVKINDVVGVNIATIAEINIDENCSTDSLLTTLSGTPNGLTWAMSGSGANTEISLNADNGAVRTMGAINYESGDNKFVLSVVYYDPADSLANNDQATLTININDRNDAPYGIRIDGKIVDTIDADGLNIGDPVGSLTMLDQDTDDTSPIFTPDAGDAWTKQYFQIDDINDVLKIGNIVPPAGEYIIKVSVSDNSAKAPATSAHIEELTIVVNSAATPCGCEQIDEWSSGSYAGYSIVKKDGSVYISSGSTSNTPPAWDWKALFVCTEMALIPVWTATSWDSWKHVSYQDKIYVNASGSGIGHPNPTPTSTTLWTEVCDDCP